MYKCLQCARPFYHSSNATSIWRERDRVYLLKHHPEALKNADCSPLFLLLEMTSLWEDKERIQTHNSIEKGNNERKRITEMNYTLREKQLERKRKRGTSIWADNKTITFAFETCQRLIPACDLWSTLDLRLSDCQTCDLTHQNLFIHSAGRMFYVCSQVPREI